MATKKKAGEQPDAPRETAKAAAPPPDKGKRYVEVSVALPPRPLMKHPETEAYWLGSLPGGPLDTYKFGGHAFRERPRSCWRTARRSVRSSSVRESARSSG